MPVDIRDGMGIVQQGFQQGQQARLGRLLGSAYNAPQGQQQALLSQAAMIDPGAAMAYEKASGANQDDMNTRLAKRVKYLAGIPEGPMREAAYQQMLPGLQAMAPGQWPTSASDPQVKGVLDAWVQAYGSDDSSLTGSMREREALLADLASSDKQRARSAAIALGMEPREVGASSSVQWQIGGDGRKRPYVWNPNTRSLMELTDQQAWELVGTAPPDSQQSQQGSQQQPQPTMGAMALGALFENQAGGQVTSVYRDKEKNAAVGGVPDSQHMTGAALDVVLPPETKAQAIAFAETQGFVAIDEGDHVHFQKAKGQIGGETGGNAPFASQPHSPSGGPSKAIGRPLEEQAAMTTAAQEVARLGLAPKFAEIEVKKAREIELAKSEVGTAADRAAMAAKNAKALAVYKAGMAGLADGLDATETGYFVGRIPAFTAGQQKAEGAISAMAPVMKQMFRDAGEGIFTDRDQQLLLDMLPSRTDLKEARDWKLANINRIVEAKLSNPSLSVEELMGGIRQPAQSDDGDLEARLNKYRKKSGGG